MTTTQNDKETFRGYEQRIALEFAQEAKSKGFDVYLAKSGKYGFCTNGTRVISFQVDHGSINLSGNYRPNGNGTGWRLDETDIEKAMVTNAPRWANTNPTYTTPEQHLKQYQDSSKYSKL